MACLTMLIGMQSVVCDIDDAADEQQSELIWASRRELPRPFPADDGGQRPKQGCNVDCTLLVKPTDHGLQQ